MRLTCPACTAAYDVPDAAVGPAGRQMRCSRCGHQWLAMPPGLAALPEPPAEPPPGPQPAIPAPEPEAEPLVAQAAERLVEAAPAARPAAGPALLVAWGASVLVLGLAAVLLWTQREGLVGAWPPMARLYSWFGA